MKMIRMENLHSDGFFFLALQLKKIQEKVMEWANEKGNHITNIIIFL